MEDQMSDEPTAVPQRGILRIAVVASEPDHVVAQQVAAALGQLQIHVLFLDLSVSSERIKQQLGMAEVCLVFVSPAIEESRLFYDAIETAILLHREFGRPVMIPIWMGSYRRLGSPVQGLDRFQGVRWRDSEDLTDLVRELAGVLEGWPGRFEFGDDQAMSAPLRPAQLEPPSAWEGPRPLAPVLPPLPVAEPKVIGEPEHPFDAEDLDAPAYLRHGPRTSSSEPPLAPAPEHPLPSAPEPRPPSAPWGTKSHPAGLPRRYYPASPAPPQSSVPRSSAPPRISRFQRLFLWARRQVAGWRIERTTDLPEGGTVDNVNLSVTAPANLGIGQVHEVRFWAHLEAQTATVVARALAALAVLDPRKLLVKTEGPFRVARSTALEITVSIEDVVLLDRSKAIIWTGEIGCATFLVTVPAQCAAGPKPGSASVRVAGTEIAKISFVLLVGSGSTRARRVQTGINRHKTAFASYASEDRDAVLARVQGIQKVAPSLKVFTDVTSLRSGDDWERKLYQMIARADVFYLFWCRHARQSAWVEKEWRCAFQAKGIDFIDPVPLESPDFAPPPPELSKKHFNEPILAYITSSSHPPPKAKSAHGL